MNILAAIKREERKLEKQLGRLNHQLNGVRAAAKAMGGSAEREVRGNRRRPLGRDAARRPDQRVPDRLQQHRARVALRAAFNSADARILLQRADMV